MHASCVAVCCEGVALAPVAAGEESDGGGGAGAEALRRVGYFELKRKEGELRYPDVAFSRGHCLGRSQLYWRGGSIRMWIRRGFFGGCMERLIWIE
jgi:hypothetical protein